MWRKLKWEITFIIVLFVALPVGLYFWRDHTLGRRLEAELSALRASGAPLTWEEAAPKQVPDDQNAAVLYQQVFRVDFSAGSSNPTFQDFDTADQEILNRFRDEPSEEDAEWLRAKLAEPGGDEAMRVLREASMRPDAVFPIPWEKGPATLFPHYAKFRAATRVMVQKANLAAYDGDMAEALDWHATILRMSRHVIGEPAMVGTLVAIAMQSMSFRELKRLLRDHQVPPGAADELDAALADFDMQGALKHALIGERALGLQCFDVAYKNPVAFMQQSGGSGTGFEALGAIGRVFGPMKKADMLTYLRSMRESISLADRPARVGRAKADALAQEIESLQFWQAPVTKMLGPGVFGRAGVKTDQAVANIDMCRLVLALRAYRREHGAYPASLRELQPALGWPIPDDPFSGKPYVYRTQDEGFILYSLGQNETDDGGMPEYDPQSDTWRGETSDIVWECIR